MKVTLHDRHGRLIKEWDDVTYWGVLDPCFLLIAEGDGPLVSYEISDPDCRGAVVGSDADHTFPSPRRVGYIPIYSSQDGPNAVTDQVVLPPLPPRRGFLARLTSA